MKKVWPWLLSVALVVVAVVLVRRYQAANAEPPIAWKTTPASRGRIAAKVTASGALQATVTVQVGAQVSGRIQRIEVDFNSTVRKGQLVAKVDPQLFQAALEQARANHLSAKAGVSRSEVQERDAELVLKRTKALHDEGLASAAELQTAQTGVAVAAANTEVARAAVVQASAALHQAQVNLSFTDIFSPIDGTVISRDVDVGQTVASSLQAPVLFTIAEDLRKMQVHTSVAESDVGRLQRGMAATFTVDAFPGQTFRGEVSQIRNAAQTLQNVVTYNAVVDVDNGDLRLRPGMTATVTIAFAERESALSVPNAAFRFRLPAEAAPVGGADAGVVREMRSPPPGSLAERGPSPSGPGARGGAKLGEGATASDASDASDPREGAQGMQKTLYVLRSGVAEPRAVIVGLSDGTMTEILGGDLSPGDPVIVDATVAGRARSSPGGGGPPGGAGGGPRMGRMF